MKDLYLQSHPIDYLPSTEDKVKGLMMRHRTLSESNKGLVENRDSMTDEVGSEFLLLCRHN